MPFLLDVNVLIARIDLWHEHHERLPAGNATTEYFVTCPLTQVLREIPAGDAVRYIEGQK